MSDLKGGLLTPQGEGGISVIVVDGPGASAFAAERLKGPHGHKPVLSPGVLAYGHFCDASGEPLDEVIIAVRDASMVEINCHGGIVPARRVMKSLEDAGVGTGEAEPPGASHLEFEAYRALMAAVTDLAARVFAAQAGGALRRAFEEAREALIEDEQDLAIETLERLCDTSSVGIALAVPNKIAFLGPVNAGKSTLVNALAGFSRNIVSEVAGTTRDAVGVPVSVLGVPVRLIDTAGAGPAEDALDHEAQRQAARAVREADALVIVVDVSAPPPPGYSPEIERNRAVVAANKIDLGPDAATLSAVREWGVETIETCGLSGLGVDLLSRAILDVIGVSVPPIDLAAGAVVFTRRQQDVVCEALAAAHAGDCNAAHAVLSEALGA